MLKIAVVTTSVRQERVGLDVANWVMDFAKQYDNAQFSLVDLADFDLPTLGSVHATGQQLQHVQNWKKTMAQFDAYIFVVAEYNHLLTGAIKNAIDFLKKEVENKVAAFVAYGGLGGARAVESFRLMLAELQVATTQKTVNFLLSYDFENFSVFKPLPYHEQNAKIMFSQLFGWANALKKIR